MGETCRNSGGVRGDPPQAGHGGGQGKGTAREDLGDVVLGGVVRYH